MSSADWYVLHQGVEEGPFPEEVLIRLAQNNIIGPDTLVRSGTADWVAAKAFPQFFTPEAGAPVAPAALELEPLASTPAPPSTHPPAPSSAETARPKDFAQLPVDFVQMQGVASLGLAGKGQVAVHQGTLFLAGKKPRFLLPGTPAEYLFSHGAARAEVPQGRTVKVLVYADQSATEWRLVTLKFRSQSVAEAFAACLPAFESSTTAEERQFAANLAKTTPYVPVTMSLIAINVLMFVLMQKDGASLSGAPGDIPIQIAWGANLGPLTKDGEWWRLISATFLHGSVPHLLMNMLALWYGGRMTERLYGNALFVLIYFGAGVAGSLAGLMWMGDTGVSVGASGAVFGVYGALLAFLLRRRNEVPAAPLVRVGTTAALLTAYSLFSGFGQSGIDNGGHMGGLLAGFLIGLACARPFDQSTRWRSWLHWPLGGAVTLGILGVLFWLLPAPTYTWRDQNAGEQAIRKFIMTDLAFIRQSESLRQRMLPMNQASRIRVIRNEMVQPFVDAESELSVVHVSRATPIAAKLELVRKYARMRRESMQHFAAFAETGDLARTDQMKKLIDEMRETQAQIDAIDAKKPANRK